MRAMKLFILKCIASLGFGRQKNLLHYFGMHCTTVIYIFDEYRLFMVFFYIFFFFLQNILTDIIVCNFPLAVQFDNCHFLCQCYILS